jgi:hypothetical protein
MIIMSQTNRTLAREDVGLVGKHPAGTLHDPAKRRINIHLLLAFLTAGVLGLTALGVAACDKAASSASGSQKRQYTCPMHPEVVKDVPGNCPKCGMKLIVKP